MADPNFVNSFYLVEHPSKEIDGLLRRNGTSVEMLLEAWGVDVLHLDINGLEPAEVPVVVRVKAGREWNRTLEMFGVAG
jgi:hypothetical protein